MTAALNSMLSHVDILTSEPPVAGARDPSYDGTMTSAGGRSTSRADLAPIDRRHFLQTLGAAVTVGTGCGGGSEEPARKKLDLGAVAIPEGRAAVAVVRRPKLDDAVERAIALAGGLGEIRAGSRVFIKPNAVHGQVSNLPGIITSVAMIQAVVRAMKARGARVTVGDRSARIFETSFVFERAGLRDAALEAGADEVFEAPKPAAAPHEWVLVKPPRYEETWGAKGGFLAMRRILESDHFIDLPVCKNHRWAAFSLSMKNLIGALGDDSRDARHFNVGDPDRLGRDVAILNQAFSPTMVILDAQTALISGGPEGLLGDRVATTPGLVMASKDRIAIDATAASLIKLELSRTNVETPDEMYKVLTTTKAWALPQIVHGIERGLGKARADLVDLRFDDVPDAKAIEALFRA